MVCKHKWEAVSVDGMGGIFTDLRAVGLFVCQKCMSYKEKELKFVKLGDKE